MTTTRFARLRLGGAAAFCAGSIALSAAFLGAAASNAADNSTVTDATHEDVVAALSVLESPQSTEDTVSKVLQKTAPDVGSYGLDLSSTRFLGASQGTKFWAGASTSNEVCLLAALPSGVVGHSCTDVSQFQRTGVAFSLEVVDTKEFVEAYLVPDKVNVAKVSNGLSTDIDGLLYGLAKSKARASVSSDSVATDDGSKFVLNMLDTSTRAPILKE